MPSPPFDLRRALTGVKAPRASADTHEKRQFSDDLSAAFARALERSMQSRFPHTTSGGGTGTNAASASGIKSIDIAFNIEGLFLGLGISVKVVGRPEEGRGYVHNLKRVAEEWTRETVDYHRYMPYSIIVGMFFLPVDSMSDRTQKTSLCATLEYFHRLRGRKDHRDDPDLMEEIYIGLYESKGAHMGSVFFVRADELIGNRDPVPVARRLAFEDVKEELVTLFKRRNPKLRVQGMG